LSKPRPRTRFAWSFNGKKRKWKELHLAHPAPGLAGAGAASLHFAAGSEVVIFGGVGATGIQRDTWIFR